MRLFDDVISIKLLPYDVLRVKVVSLCMYVSPAGMRVVQRRGQVFYINAHSVHFHDDHYAVEDDDGDSVDYDYEF